MLEALLADAVALTDIRATVVLCDAAVESIDKVPNGIAVQRCRDQDDTLGVLTSAARTADFVLPVAPESDRLLLTIAQRLKTLPCTTLLPPASIVEQCSDKLQTWNVFESPVIPMLPCDVNCIDSTQCSHSNSPVIFKPRFGTGCEGIQRHSLPSNCDMPDYFRQPWVTGRSLSVGILSGFGGPAILPIVEQKITWEDDRPTYHGGTIPAILSKTVEATILEMTHHILQKFGHFSGYVGMDFLVAEADEAVYLNEINPRFCTSYIGYRRMLETNPLEVPLNHTSGVNWRDPQQTVSFDANAM